MSLFQWLQVSFSDIPPGRVDICFLSNCKRFGIYVH